jgi:hypothetical protein
MVAREVVLHVGLQETGAEELQVALEQLRPQLHRRGVGFVGHAAITGLDALGGWLRGRVPGHAAVPDFERGLGRLLDREAEEVGRTSGEVRAIIVSSDHLLGREALSADDARDLRPWAVPAVAQAIRASGASAARVVVYVRRPDRLLELSYLRAIERGGSHGLADQFRSPSAAVLDLAALEERLTTIPEVRQIDVRHVEAVEHDPARYVDDILTLLGLGGQLDLSGLQVAPSRRYSRRAWEIALDVNPLLDTEEERRQLRAFLLEQFPEPEPRAARFLTGAERTRIVDAHARADPGVLGSYRTSLASEVVRDTGSEPLMRSEVPATGAPDVPAERRPRARREGLRRLSVAAERARSRYRMARADVLLVGPPDTSAWIRMAVGITLARQTGASPRDPLRFTGGTRIARDLPRILAVGQDEMQHAATWSRRDRRVILIDPSAGVPSQLERVVAVVRGEDVDRDPAGTLRAVLAAMGVGPADARWVEQALAEVPGGPGRTSTATREGAGDTVAAMPWGGR